MSKAGLKSVARAVLYGLIVKQAAVVVPFACHMAVLAGLDEFFQSAPEQFRRGFHSLYVVDSYSLVERMERNEVVPCCRPCLECVQNVRVDYESFLRWRQCRTSAVGHQSEGFKPSAPLFVQFGPPAVFGAAAETLQCRPPDVFYGGIYPSEAQGFFYCVKIPQDAILWRRLSAFYGCPAFCFSVMVFYKPFPERIAAGGGNDVYGCHFCINSSAVNVRKCSVRMSPKSDVLPCSV